jgi:NADPH-dependent ferric siderophore reductase
MNDAAPLPSHSIGQSVQRHQVLRQRHDVRRRRITLHSKESPTPRMLRLGFHAAELHDFTSPSPDDHVKLFFPGTDGGAASMRDFTPRRFERERGILVIDFALHDGGPANDWAVSAQIGDTLEIGGPRGSTVVSDDFDWYLLIGDETALPAIGRRVEELRAGVPVTTCVAIADEGEMQSWQSAAELTALWVTRKPSADDASLLRAALAGQDLRSGDGFVWIAAEASVARALRNYIIDERRHPKVWTKAAGYWKRGEPDGGERIED